jgi:energy-coupling factor transporter ATP-binding protein EcfA2
MQFVLSNIRYARGDFRVSADGSFSEGIHLVSGKVGSGKSTFALLSAGYIAPMSGNISREGISRIVLSMQFPEYHITGITLNDEIRSWGIDVPGTLDMARLQGRGRDDIASLSRGELKRLHLACVLSVNTDLLILDEPFSALDCNEKKIVSGQINTRAKGIVIICTHEHLWFPDVDYIWEIQEGNLVSRGKVPGAIPRWQLVPKIIRDLMEAGIIPDNISPRAIMEAVCRTRE